MPYYIKDPKRNPNFDNHPDLLQGLKGLGLMLLIGLSRAAGSKAHSVWG